MRFCSYAASRAAADREERDARAFSRSQSFDSMHAVGERGYVFGIRGVLRGHCTATVAGLEWWAVLGSNQ